MIEINEGNEVERYDSYNGRRKWQVRKTIPLEISNDSGYIEHIKRELTEVCVKEYIKNTEESLVLRMNPMGRAGVVEITLELDDLLALKDENKRLRNEIDVILDKYKILEEINRSRK